MMDIFMYFKVVDWWHKASSNHSIALGIYNRSWLFMYSVQGNFYNTDVTFGFTSTLHRMNCVHPNSANLFCGDQLLNLQPLEAKTGRLWNDKLPNTSYWDFKFKKYFQIVLMNSKLNSELNFSIIYLKFFVNTQVIIEIRQVPLLSDTCGVPCLSSQ